MCITYILMINQLHQLELSVRSLGMRNILEGPTKLLYGYVLLRNCINSSTEIIHPKLQNFTKLINEQKKCTFHLFTEQMLIIGLYEKKNQRK